MAIEVQADADAPIAGASAVPSRSIGTGWLLTLLTAGFGLNLLDRQIISILAEPIKRDLELADWQLGALSGLSFALLYSFAALPIARFADRSNRARVVGCAILIWSAFTAASSLAANFLQILLLRVGVGVGEAGGAPASQALIADRVPPDRRAGALAIFALGAPVGAAIGLIGGGMLEGVIGWRWTIACAGLPGIVIGVLVLITLRDDRPHEERTITRPGLLPSLKTMLGHRTFGLIALGSAFMSFCNYGTMAFAGSYYLRLYTPELTELGARFGQHPLGVIGVGLGLTGALGGSLGAISGGRLADRLAQDDPRLLALIPAAGSLLGTIAYVAMFTVPSALASILTFTVAAFFTSVWYGPGNLALQRLAGPGNRAVAMAVALFINSAIGLSFGPLLIGMASDMFAPVLGEGKGLQAGILVGLLAGVISTIMFWAASRSISSDILTAESSIA